MYVRTYVCMYVWGYVCMRVRMYVCSCMCVTKVRVKDAACQRWSWRWWHRGTVPGRRSVEHECSWLSMQLWRTSTERMPVKARHSHRHLHAFTKRATQCHLYHACHAKRPWMCHCATPATWNLGGCHQVPRLPRRSGAASRASRAPKPRPSAPPSAICTTPAAQNDRGCAIVPRLPREIKVDVTKCHACHAEVARRHGRLNQDQARHPVPSVPRLPRKTTVDVRLCHAKSRWMSPSATPATQKWRGVTGVTGVTGA